MFSFSLLPSGTRRQVHLLSPLQVCSDFPRCRSSPGGSLIPKEEPWQGLRSHQLSSAAEPGWDPRSSALARPLPQLQLKQSASLSFGISSSLLSTNTKGGKVSTDFIFSHGLLSCQTQEKQQPTLSNAHLPPSLRLRAASSGVAKPVLARPPIPGWRAGAGSTTRGFPGLRAPARHASLTQGEAFPARLHLAQAWKGFHTV